MGRWMDGKRGRKRGREGRGVRDKGGKEDKKEEEIDGWKD